MWSTPAPPLTALVASAIWSGVGEVNTSPGQAASSIPRPTKPPCMGSCPEPPPDTMPTLPSSGSRTTASGALMSFFIADSAPVEGVERHGARHHPVAQQDQDRRPDHLC